ncbi:MAG: hypothetical protein ACYSTQ_03875 [Planctomycetota bacterium]|jgi:hypothetical protein
MGKSDKKLAIFAHSGTYDRLYQVVTIAITAASVGSGQGSEHIPLLLGAEEICGKGRS